MDHAIARKRVLHKRGRLSLNRIFLELGANKKDVYRRGTIQGYHGRIPGTFDNTTIYSNTDKETLLSDLRKLYIIKAKKHYPRTKNNDGTQMVLINFLYEKGKSIIEHHYSGYD